MERRVTLEREMNEKQLTIERLTETGNRSEQDMSQLQQRSEELEIALEKTTRKAKRSREKAVKIVSQLSEDLANTSNELAVAKAQLQQLAEDNELLRSAVKRLADNSQEAQLNESLQQISMLRTENESLHALESSISELQDQNTELHRQLEQQSERMKDIDDQNMVIRARCERLQADHNELGRLREENRSLKEQMKKIGVESRDAQIRALRQENQKLQATLNETDQKLKKKIEMMTKIKKEQDTSVEVLTEQNELLVAALKNAKKEFKVQKKLNVDYVQQMMELKSSMTLSESIPGTPIQQRTADGQSIKRISELEEELNESKATINRLTEQIRSSTNDTEQLEEKLSSCNYELVKAKQVTDLKISQIIAQARALFDISSLDDIPKVLKDAKQQISESNGILMRIRNTCKAKEGSDIVAEVRKLRQEWDSYSEQIKAICTTLGITAVERVSRGVSELKSQSTELREREKRVCELLNLRDSNQLIKHIAKVSKLAKSMQDVCSCLKTDNEAQALHTVEDLVTIRACLNENIGYGDVETVTKYIENSVQVREREKRIMEMLTVYSEKNLEAAVQNLVKKGDEYRSLQGSLRLTSDSQRVSQLSVADQCCREVCQLLELSKYEDIPETVNELLDVNAQMNELEEKVMVSLSVVSPESIVPRLQELRATIAEQEKILKQICKTMNVRDENEVVQQIRMISRDVQSTLTLKETLRTDDVCDSVKDLQTSVNRKQKLLIEIREKLHAGTDEQIIPTISLLQRDKATLQAVKSMLPSQFVRGEIEQNVHEILEQLNAYKHEVDDISDLLNCRRDGIKANIAHMNNQFRFVSELFTRLMSFITLSKMNVTFPVDESVARKLSALVDDYKSKLQEERAQIDVLMHKAMSFGYHGDNITEAVDTVVAACSEYHRSDMADRMHKDLMDVRSTNERQQQRSQKQIDKLRHSLDETRAQAEERENNLLKQLNDEKRKVQELQADLGNEQRVHEELMQLLCGQAHDAELLKSKLGKSDAKVVQQAEDTLAFIQEMNKRKSESEQIVSLQRQERQSLLKSARTKKGTS